MAARWRLVSWRALCGARQPYHWVVETEPAWAQFTAEIDGFLPSVPAAPARLGVLDALTPHELQVIELLAAGLDNGTIGRRLGISAKTVRNRGSIIFGKLGVNSRPQAIVWARDAGFGRLGRASPYRLRQQRRLRATVSAPRLIQSSP